MEEKIDNIPCSSSGVASTPSDSWSESPCGEARIVSRRPRRHAGDGGRAHQARTRTPGGLRLCSVRERTVCRFGSGKLSPLDVNERRPRGPRGGTAGRVYRPARGGAAQRQEAPVYSLATAVLGSVPQAARYCSFTEQASRRSEYETDRASIPASPGMPRAEGRRDVRRRARASSNRWGPVSTEQPPRASASAWRELVVRRLRLHRVWW